MYFGVHLCCSTLDSGEYYMIMYYIFTVVNSHTSILIEQTFKSRVLPFKLIEMVSKTIRHKQ